MQETVELKCWCINCVNNASDQTFVIRFDIFWPWTTRIIATFQNYNLLKLGERNLELEKAWTFIH